MAASVPASPHFDIDEFQVVGGSRLTEVEIDEAVYPYVGPYRTPDDVEKARAALEKALQDKGYQTVTVRADSGGPQGGVVTLRVVEVPIGHVRVNGSRYFAPAQIKAEAPSLKEGTVPNFNAVTRDIVSLNQLPDRRVTPTLHTGIDPDTVDVDLNVKDSPPFHGSLELNNRYSQDTSPLRVNGSASYDNLWQAGHSIGFSFQVAPQDTREAKVFSGYYLARIPDVDWISFMVQGTDQDSNVSTLGGAAVAGKGQTIGGRAIFNLPQQKDFYQSLTLGVDYKHYDQDVVIGGVTEPSPITYYPFSASYSGTWIGKGYTTQLDAAVNLHFRGLGSSPDEFDVKRFDADASYIYFRGDLSHTRDLPGGFQAFGKVQGQAADVPLIDSEQFAAGGLDTARGYLESEVLGDNALFGSAELRSPSFGRWLGSSVGDWRVYAFADAGWATINDPLPEQTSSFTLASVGVGSRLRLVQYLNGSLDAGIPLISGPQSGADSVLLTFRVWADF